MSARPPPRCRPHRPPGEAREDPAPAGGDPCQRHDGQLGADDGDRHAVYPREMHEERRKRDVEDPAGERDLHDASVLCLTISQ